MRTLPHPNNLHLQSAIGWLELGNPTEAHHDLDKIAPEFQSDSEVMKIRCAAWDRAGKWDIVEQITREYTAKKPKDNWGWNHLSIALYRQGKTQEAHDLLQSVLPKFLKDWLTHYNLACYCVQLGHHLRGAELLRIAFDLSPDPRDTKVMALKDPDLKVLWPAIRDELTTG